MSGHSKWATTHRQKEAADQKRGAVFTRLAKNITVAARENGDPETNFKLRIAVESAKQANMPKENIERAIRRGTGALTGQTLEEVTYEAFGPDGVALIIKTITDNKNRTVSEIKNVLSKNAGKLAGPNAVNWMFEQKGVISIPNLKNQIPNLDELQLSLIEAGAEDFQESQAGLTVYANTNNLQKIKESLESQNIKTQSAAIEYVPKKENLIEPTSLEKIEQLLNALSEAEDVEEIYTNIK